MSFDGLQEQYYSVQEFENREAFNGFRRVHDELRTVIHLRDALEQTSFQDDMNTIFRGLKMSHRWGVGRGNAIKHHLAELEGSLTLAEAHARELRTMIDDHAKIDWLAEGPTAELPQLFAILSWDRKRFDSEISRLSEKLKEYDQARDDVSADVHIRFMWRKSVLRHNIRQLEKIRDGQSFPTSTFANDDTLVDNDFDDEEEEEEDKDDDTVTGTKASPSSTCDDDRYTHATAAEGSGANAADLTSAQVKDAEAKQIPHPAIAQQSEPSSHNTVNPKSRTVNELLLGLDDGQTWALHSQTALEQSSNRYNLTADNNTTAKDQLAKITNVGTDEIISVVKDMNLEDK